MKAFPDTRKPAAIYLCTCIRLIVLSCISLLSACQQLSDTFEETRHPRPQQPQQEPDNDTVYTTSGTGSSSTSSTSVVIVSGKADHRGSIFEMSPEGWDSIQRQLYRLPGFNNQKLFLYQGLFIYDYQGGMISVNLQDPAHKEQIDAYRYCDGKWERQQPVKISGNMAVENFLIPLEDVKFSTIHKIYAIAKARAADMPDTGPITHIYFEYMKRPLVKQWYLKIPGSRKDYFLEFDLNGNLKKIR